MKFSLDNLVREKRRGYQHRRRSLIAGIGKANRAIIAEIKKKSPSEGRLKEMNATKVAKAMEKNGACAISVLTDEKHFNGSLEDLRLVRESVKVPVLRKDFIVDELQLYESMVFRADAVLLIARILKGQTMRFVEKAHTLGLETLVEVHDRRDLGHALRSKSRLIGINNRDLKTLEIDLETTRMLTPLIPRNRIIVAESGVRDADDVDRLFDYGADAILVGTSIMKSMDIGKTIRTFTR